MLSDGGTGCIPTRRLVAQSPWSPALIPLCDLVKCLLIGSFAYNLDQSFAGVVEEAKTRKLSRQISNACCHGSIQCHRAIEGLSNERKTA
jgi:hypothetical protein